jgi:acyl-coenzyme A synthetase/AMP-(fatty) acid ligase
MNPALIVAILGAGGLGAIVAAVVTGLFSKRKLGAEATEIITKAAAGVVTSLQGELARSEAARLTQQIEYQATITKIKDDHDAEMADVRRVLQLHVAWDAIAIAKMAEQGIHLPPAPPLLPPRLQGEVH